MNTKIENAKSVFFTSKEHYLNFRKAWANAVNTNGVTAAHHLLYNLLRGYDVARGFTPISNKNKLSNGMAINHGLYVAYSDLKHIVWYVNQIEQETKRLVETQSELTLGNLINQVTKGKIAESRIRSLQESIAYKQKQLDKFLSPFAGTVSVETLVNLIKVMPAIERLESNYGNGKVIANDIINNGRKITYQDIWALYGE